MDANAMAYRKPWHGLFERLLREWDERQVADPDAAETTLPSAEYTDPARYRAELNTLFHRLPLCLGHEDQFPPGSVLAREIAGLPLLLTRTPGGRISVFLNACRHRGVRLMAGEDAVCERTSLSCPYHGWTYGLDGRLLSVPRRDAFPSLDLTAHGLRQLPSAVRHGLIWAVLDAGESGPLEIASHLGGLDEDLMGIGIEGHRFFRQNAVLRKANWKLIVDAFVEFYHIKRLHAASIGPYFADTKAASECVGPHLRMLVGREEFERARGVPPDQWSPQQHASLVHFVFPNSLIVYHPDYISHIGVFPAGIDQSLFVHSVLTPEAPIDEKAQAHWERSFDLIDAKVFNDEDLLICEQIQSGLAATKDSAFLLGRLETNVRQFHDTVAAALATGERPAM